MQSTDKAPFSVRGRRLKHEWRFLCDLVSLNPRLLSSPEWIPQPPVDSFRFRLHETTGLVQQDSAWAPITEHAAELRFPRFFPAVPMELYLRTPVFHPNVDPLNGFVCLWQRHSTGYTVIEAVLRLQGILTFRLINFEAPHIMQPEAVDYARTLSAPLPCRELVVDAEWRLRSEIRRPAGQRRRLSELQL